jgi:hypothetical protein
VTVCSARRGTTVRSEISLQFARERERFWSIVEDARAETGSDSERIAQALLRRLRVLQPDDIEQFQDLWEQAQDEVYRWPISDAATLLLGPVGDFLAVQDWIVSHGRETVRRIQDDDILGTRNVVA